MKMKLLQALLMRILCLGVISFAQTNIAFQSMAISQEDFIGKPVMIVQSDGKFYMAPRWSPDGHSIAFTSAKYKGIWIKNLTTGETRQITDEDAAGFGFEWSPDSKSILSRVAKYEGMIRLNAVKIFSSENDEEEVLTEYRTRMPALPHWSSKGEKIYLYNGKKIEILKSSSSSSTSESNGSEKIVYHTGNQIFIGESATQNFTSLEALNNREYLNVNVSPDGLKIAFEVYGGNLYIMNSDGTGLVEIGKGNRPQWSADSRRIVYMVTEDDGHTVTSSDIYTVTSDGTQKIRLTKTEGTLEMDPCWSPDGKNIVYHEMNEGAIYILPVSIP